MSSHGNDNFLSCLFPLGVLLLGVVLLIQYDCSTGVGVHEGQNDVGGEVIHIVVGRLPAILSSEATVKHGELVLLGLRLLLVWLGELLEPGDLGSEGEGEEERE